MSHTATDINQAAADLTHAFNDADWDRFRNRLAPELVYNETGTGRRAEGVDAYLALCQGWKEAMPDVSGTIRKSDRRRRHRRPGGALGRHSHRTDADARRHDRGDR